MTRRRTQAAHAVPFVGANPYRAINGPPALFVAVLSVGDGYFCVEYQIGLAQVVAFVVKHAELETSRYRKLTDNVAPQVADLKAKALNRGATLEAIQLLGQLTPLTTKEEVTMATANKLSRQAGDTEALKKAAAAAPTAPATTGRKRAAAAAAPAEAPKKRGNVEALAKAREARAAGGAEYDKQKITIVATENPYRAGTKAAATFDLFKRKGIKTVADVKAAATDAHDLGYLRYASRDGHIKLG